MKKYALFVLLTIGLLAQSGYAQLFVGVGANAQLSSLKDSYRSSESRVLLGDVDKAQLSWSPALRLEYVLSADAYLSGTFNHFVLQDYGYEVPSTGTLFNAEQVSAVQGRIMGGWVFDHFGLEGGVVILQSYQNQRRLMVPTVDRTSSIVDVFTDDAGFTQLYPCISGTYKQGQWLGVLSGTFSSDRFSPGGQELVAVVPRASVSLGVFYLWKAVSSPRLTSPRF